MRRPIGSRATFAFRTPGGRTDDAKKLAKQDQKWAEYVRRRDAAGQSPEALADLARWCHKNHMVDQARAHWQAVLKLQPDNQEAIRNLGLRPYNGILLTPAEIQQAKSQLRAVEKATERWQSLVTQWRAATERHEATESIAALEKARKVFDTAEMQGLEKALWRFVGSKSHNRLYCEMVLALIAALHDNPNPAAAESLARYAVLSNSKELRDAAIKELEDAANGPLRADVDCGPAVAA